MSYRLALALASSRGHRRHHGPLEGCRVYCAPMRRPSPMRVRALAARAGAVCVYVLDATVTHVVTRVAEAAGTAAVVGPEWVFDSLARNRREDEAKYRPGGAVREMPVVPSRSEVRRAPTPFQELLRGGLQTTWEALSARPAYYGRTPIGRVEAVQFLLLQRFLAPEGTEEGGGDNKSGGDEDSERNEGDRTVLERRLGRPFVAFQHVIEQRCGPRQLTALWRLEMADFLLEHPPDGPAPDHARGVLLAHVHDAGLVVRAALSALPPEAHHCLEAEARLGRPVVVTVQGSSGCAAVVGWNEAAGACGVRAEMLVADALRLARGAAVVPYAFEAARRLGRQLFGRLRRLSRDVMCLGCDEAVVDVSGQARPAAPDALVLGAQLRAALGEAVCVGLGDSRLSARVAARCAPGNGGLCFLDAAGCAAELVTQPVDVLEPGDPTALRDSLGVATCGELAGADPARLAALVGRRAARKLRLAARGRLENALDGFAPVGARLGTRPAMKPTTAATAAAATGATVGVTDVTGAALDRAFKAGPAPPSPLPTSPSLRGYAFPRRAYAPVAVVTADGARRVQPFLLALEALEARSEAADRRDELRDAALESFVAQLVADGDLEGVVRLARAAALPGGALALVRERIGAGAG
ncbi:DNA damage repair protein [Giardia muris]|uniref:DNA damage repair protein n=1 Tax=Giardia muris TaxID=5742 RepID=A0A4Z1SRU3_GIAMU|nr:DNA damage repair protein [Giardia muris]|eukprot:TNJ27705.1 DNA damage repair protein [Giardia muris]